MAAAMWCSWKNITTWECSVCGSGRVRDRVTPLGPPIQSTHSVQDAPCCLQLGSQNTKTHHSSCSRFPTYPTSCEKWRSVFNCGFLVFSRGNLCCRVDTTRFMKEKEVSVLYAHLMSYSRLLDEKECPNLVIIGQDRENPQDGIKSSCCLAAGWGEEASIRVIHGGEAMLRP